LAQNVGTDLLVLNDIDRVLFEFVGLRPGFTPTKPDLELISVPEGDIGGGLAVYFLSLLSGRIANFIEPFYIDEQNGGFVAGHAGPNNYTERPENMIIARDERFAKSKWKYAGAPFAWYVFPEGEKTMLHVSEENGKLKLVATLVECLPTKHYLASYSHANFRHKTLPPCELFKRIGECGVNQHFGIVSGNLLEELKVFASLMGFDLYVIE
jgi:L-arabinose isomerase